VAQSRRLAAILHNRRFLKRTCGIAIGGMMFGLPIETVLLVFGFPVFWILYTIVFFVVTRDWGKDVGVADDAP
jgi:hypothetical protein